MRKMFNPTLKITGGNLTQAVVRYLIQAPLEHMQARGVLQLKERPPAIRNTGGLNGITTSLYEPHRACSLYKSYSKASENTSQGHYLLLESWTTNPCLLRTDLWFLIALLSEGVSAENTIAFSGDIHLRWSPLVLRIVHPWSSARRFSSFNSFCLDMRQQYQYVKNMSIANSINQNNPVCSLRHHTRGSSH